MVSEFDIDGNLITHDIVSTNGYTRNLLQDGTVAFVLGHNKGKWSNKFSAVEIIIDHIYIMPTPLRPTNPLSEMTTITTTQTPHPRLQPRLPSRSRDLPKCDIPLQSIALPPLLKFNQIITHLSPTFWRSVPAGVTLNLPRGGSPLPSVASQITVGPMPLETSPVPSA